MSEEGDLQAKRRLLRAPFPWFGGKSRASALVWRGFGDVANYVEPFAGSLAVLLARPSEPGIETVNDRDAWVSNFWRALQASPEEVARFADWPVNEADLHARHRWLVAQTDFVERMKRDPDYYDAKIAGWWVWGICQWIGSGWCTIDEGENGKRPAIANKGSGVHSRFVDWSARPASNPMGVNGKRVRDLSNSSEWEKRPELKKGGRGVHRISLKKQLPSLSGSRGAAGHGVHASGLPAKMPRSAGTGTGVHRKMLKADRGTASRLQTPALYEWMDALAARLRRVRVCCGDWKRVLGRSSTECIGVTGIFLAPPYSAEAGRAPSLYAHDDLEIAHEVREWALEHGDNPKLRICLAGYEGEHDMPPTWESVAWKANGGYAAAAGNDENAKKERLWFSPACADVARQLDFFGGAR